MIFTHHDQDGTSTSGGERNDNVSWNSRKPRLAKDDVKDIKEALDDQATRIGGK